MFEQLIGEGGIDAVAGAQEVHCAEADQHGDGGDHHGHQQCAPANAAERGEIAHLGHAHDDRREQQRQHQHEQKAEEDLADRAGDVAGELLHPLRVGADGEIDPQPRAQADGEADQHHEPQRNAARLRRFHPAPLCCVG
ncbi:MAG: hypothetical protein R3C16_04800 [Hyphomonadaceae bacterium]